MDSKYTNLLEKCEEDLKIIQNWIATFKANYKGVRRC